MSSWALERSAPLTQPEDPALTGLTCYPAPPFIYAICCFDFGSALTLIYTLAPHSFNQKKRRRCWSCPKITDPKTGTLGTLDSATFNPQTTGGKNSGSQLVPFEREKTKGSRDPTSSAGCMYSERSCRNLISISVSDEQFRSLFSDATKGMDRTDTP